MISKGFLWEHLSKFVTLSMAWKSLSVFDDTVLNDKVADVAEFADVQFATCWLAIVPVSNIRDWVAASGLCKCFTWKYWKHCLPCGFWYLDTVEVMKKNLQEFTWWFELCWITLRRSHNIGHCLWCCIVTLRWFVLDIVEANVSFLCTCLFPAEVIQDVAVSSAKVPDYSWRWHSEVCLKGFRCRGSDEVHWTPSGIVTYAVLMVHGMVFK